MSPDELHQEAQALAESLTHDRRHLHRHPELAGEERQTAQFIAGRLRRLGLEPELLLDGTAAFADLEGEGGDGPTLLLRADTDALPIQERHEEREYRSEVAGAMHACGHDGHVAIALGAAELLQRRRAGIRGRVRIVFQPAEETANGAERLIEAGVMDHPQADAALGLHLWGGARVGLVGVRDDAIFASADEFELELRGRGGHAALPHQALDPVPIAALVVLALQTLVSRETDPAQTAVVTVGMVRAGQAFNVIPELVTLRGTVRSFTEEARQRLLRRVEELARAICQGYGAELEMRLGAACPPVICDPRISALVRRAVAGTPGAEATLPQPLTVGDDMALFLRRVPGCYFLLGAGAAEEGFSAPHHHPDFDIDERCLPVGAEVLARSALEYLGA
ncbi:MAG: M20 metallopeptidase family protein [Candidatus Dormibacteria bacterium]